MYVAVALVLGLVTLLVVPVDLVFTARRKTVFDGRVRVGWLWGLISVGLGGGRDMKRGPRRRVSGRRRTGASGAGVMRKVVRIARSSAFRRRCIGFGGRLLRCLHFRDLGLKARLGFDDPADTGWVAGVAGPLAGVMGAGREIQMELDFCFDEPVVHLDVQGTLRVVPGEVLFVTTGFLLSPAVLRAAWMLARGDR